MALGVVAPASAVAKGRFGCQKCTRRRPIRLAATNASSVETYTAILQDKQLDLLKAFEDIDGSSKKFQLDKWSRSESSFGMKFTCGMEYHIHPFFSFLFLFFLPIEIVVRNLIQMTQSRC